MTQKESVLEALRMGPVCSFEFYQSAAMTHRLAARIFDLRRDGGDMTYRLYHEDPKNPPRPFDSAAAFADTGAGHLEEVRVLDPEEAHQQARVFAPDYTPRRTEEVPARSRARQLEGDVLDDSHAAASDALDLVQEAVELFNARRDMPQHHRRLLVALKDLIAEIETERAVFDRRERT